MEQRTQLHIINGGIGLILLGFLFGLVYTYAVEHRALLHMKDGYEAVFVRIAVDPGDAAWRSELESIKSRNLRNTRAIDVHTHVINLGILALLIGLLYPLLPAEGIARRLTGPLFLNAAWIYPAGLLLQMLAFKRFGELIAALGAAAAIAAFAVFCIGVLRSASPAGGD